MKKIFLILLVFGIASTALLAAEKKSITKKEFIDSNIKKLEQQFNAIDSNKDGKMTPAEERAYVQRVQKAITEKEPSNTSRYRQRRKDLKGRRKKTIN